MDKDYNPISVNQDIFTIDDAREAAKQLFKTQVNDFNELKNEKWYKHLLNAITFGADRKKKVIKNISSLSKLQTIFMRVYCENYKGLDSQLNEIIENLTKTNETVRKIYVNYIVGVRSQKSVLDLSAFEQDILLLLLCAYSSNGGNEEDLKKFKAGVAQAIGRSLPQGEFKPKLLEQINAGEVFYRLILEMCVVDGYFDIYSAPENILEATRYLSISQKSKENIEKMVSDELNNFGLNYLITKYGITEDELLDDDIELTDEEAIDEQFATVIIDKEMRIAKGSTQVYKNKEVFFHANVICGGKLVFENCMLKYNDKAVSGKIKIEEGGHFIATDSTFISMSFKEEYFCDSEGKIDLKNSRFIDCAYLFSVVSDFSIIGCELINCANRFLYVWYRSQISNKIKICDNLIRVDEYKQFNLDDWCKDHDGSIIRVIVQSVFKDNIQFNNNVIREGKVFSKNNYKLTYVEAKSVDITQCSFYNMSGNICGSVISECYFRGCKNYTLNKFMNVDSCIFEECEDIILAKDNLKITNCQFLSCKNKIIDGTWAYDGGILVENCVFKNLTNDFTCDEDSERTFCCINDAADASAFLFKREKKSSEVNKVYRCIFDGVKMDKAFLIAIRGYERPREDTVALVADCIFLHCETRRESKKLIREYFVYRGLFDKLKSVNGTKISNCKGLEKINCEGSEASNLDIKWISTSGRKIGADVESLDESIE